ncbi:geranylgeranylglycerol-phosphate geranylgeranyltransferase [Caldivirga maquilingensis]|uniref:UbiA prenyltransferase n=1 Tax=Caldivirga maquilingensis (strain ATCC 700844 / DSM 13496 / JCM 10307 / IC-167) TaxID=397948 RepID=A8MDD4_CALMQ|nr:geranylgeranylglycerol-phosphate geranylgeranyltransferase [Caldivirga maquilingensis]ABW01790.1 UbiA prenyltransferase [Caldivirga maquilingensis IC-167]
MASKVTGVVKLGRMEHGLLAAITVVASYYVSGGRNGYVSLILFASTFFAEVFLFVTNDIHNINEDRINRPNAPLVMGVVTFREALWLGLVSLVLSFIQVIPVVMDWANSLSLIVLATALVLGYLYNSRLKRVMIINNVVVALVTSLTYLYGLASVKVIKPQPSLFITLLFLTTVVATLGREIVKGSLDYEGDLKVGVRTIATTYGRDTANKAGSIVMMIAVALSIPLIIVSSAVLGRFSSLFIIFIILTDSLILTLSIRVIKGNLRLFRELSLLAMGLTLIGLMLCSLLIFIYT